jgi:hypothetical protein
VSADNVFGTIVTGKMVRTAMRRHVQQWFPTYIAEIARNDGRDPAEMPLFRSFPSALDMPDGKFVEDQMPSCVIVAPGLIEDPRRHRGMYLVRWGVSVGAVVSGQDRENTFDLSELYAAAVRALVLQHPSLGGFASATDWEGERYDDIPNDMSRTLAAGTVQFAVEVQEALDATGGPDAPLTDPIPDPGPRATFTVADATTEGA